MASTTSTSVARLVATTSTTTIGITAITTEREGRTETDPLDELQPSIRTELGPRLLADDPG